MHDTKKLFWLMVMGLMIAVQGCENADEVYDFPGDIGAKSCASIKPGVLDFGTVEINTKKTLVLTVSNRCSQEALVISPNGIHTTPGSDPGLRIENPPEQDITVAPKTELKLHISWTPTRVDTGDHNDLGAIAIDAQGGIGMVVPAKGMARN